MDTSTFEEETTRFSSKTEHHSPRDANLRHGITENSTTPLQKPGTSTVYKIYEGRSESKERFAIQRYLLIIGKKQNMQVLSFTFTYFST